MSKQCLTVYLARNAVEHQRITKVQMGRAERKIVVCRSYQVCLVAGVIVLPLRTRNKMKARPVVASVCELDLRQRRRRASSRSLDRALRGILPSRLQRSERAAA